MLTIAVDTNASFTSQAGSARYVRGLLSGFRSLAAPDLDVRELAWPVYNLEYRQPARSLRTIYRELIWSRTAAARQLRAWKCDMLHVAGVMQYPELTDRRVMTLFDLAILRHPERFRRWHKLAWKRRIPYLRSMDRVLCISRFTADEAMQLLHIPAGKLDVVYCGNSLAVPAVPVDLEPLSLPGEFLLYVGTLEPGKNLNLLREVWLHAQSRGEPLPPLVVVGSRREGVAREAQPPASWRFLGVQPDGVLAALYGKAVALLFPSRYEGFGLPVLEAISLGCPVICTRSASLPEVGGEAVLYADPTPDAFLDAIRLLRRDASLAAMLAHAGREQAKKFSWTRCASETAAIYRSVCGA